MMLARPFRALVTGAAGFIGSRLVHALARDGHEVIAFDDLSALGSWALIGEAPGNVTLVEGDVRDAAQLDRLPGGEWHRVYHLAACFANARSIADPALDWGTNVGGTENVLASARKRGSGLFVYTGSSSSYGDALPPFKEDDLPRPVTPYGRSKLAAEQLVRGTGLPFAIFRLFNVYGPGDYPGPWRNVIPNMAASLARNGTAEVFGAAATRDFSFVDDVIEVLLRAERGTGRVLNVGTGVETPIFSLALQLARLLRRPEEAIRPRPARAWDSVERRCADTTRLREFLGQVPSTRLESGLGVTLEWLRSQGHLGGQSP